MKPKPILLANVKQSDVIRFMNFVDSESSEHWLWTSGLTNGGYARFWFNGITVLAHRFAFVAFNRVDDDGSLVSRHTCGIIKCVNPDHLTKGTQLQNVWDSLNGGTKVGRPIDDDELRFIVKLSADGVGSNEIGRITGRNHSSIWVALKRARVTNVSV